MTSAVPTAIQKTSCCLLSTDIPAIVPRKKTINDQEQINNLLISPYILSERVFPRRTVPG